MSTLVELKLDSAAVDLGPGETATLQITVTNLSGVVDAFGLKIMGLDPAWYTLAPAEVSLFPSKSSQIQLQLHPPRGTYAGPYPFTVLATSRDNPLESSTVGATLNMAAEGGAALGIEPKRIKGKSGLFVIALTNGANTPRSVILSVTDPEEALRYTLGTPSVQQAEAGDAASLAAAGANPSTPPTARPTLLGETTAQGEKFVEHELEVPAGSTLTIPLQVKPLKRVWTGRERVFTFQAGTHPPGVEWEPRDALKAQAELVYRPVFAAWAGVPIGMRRLLAIGIPLLLLLLIFWLLLRPQPGPSDALVGLQATQTAQARSAQQTQTAIADQLAAAQNDATRTALSREAEAAAANATQTAQANANVAGSTQTALAVASATAAAVANGVNGAADGVPSINRFWLVVPDANAVGPANLGVPNLEWDVTGAVSVRVIEANQPLALGGLDTASQVEYQLIVTGTNSITGTSQVATSTLSVIFIRPPLISALNVSQATINAGGSTSLSWQVKGARSATLDGVAVDLGPGGTGSIDLSPSATHRYILCVSNQAGTVCRSAKVTVIPAGTPIPTNTPAPVTPSPTPCTLDYSVIQQSGVQMVPGVNDVGNHCDNCTTSVGLPFSFKLYDQSYSSAIVGSNGTIGFVSNTNPITNTCFPNPQLNYAIMPHWDDLTTNGPGLGVFTSVSGNAPNRIFNIEWRAARAVPIAANRALLQPVVTPSTAPPVNFVVRLHENSPVQQFDVIYGRVDDLGNGATIGVQRGTGANFTQYACNTSDIEEGLQLTFLLSCGTSVPPTPSDGGGGRNTLTCGPSVVDIRIVNGAPQPRNVTVNVGTTVRWINLDATQRSFGGIITGTASVAGNPGTTQFNSGTLNQSASFEYTFTTPGVYTYSSPGDPNLSGTITVVVACTPTPSSTVTATPTGTTIPGTAGPTSTDVPIIIGTATTISSPTSELTNTAIPTDTATPTGTDTSTPIPTETATLIPTNTPRDGGPPPTSPPQRTATRTASRTATRTATLTATRTPQPTFTPGCVISDYSIQSATGAIAPGTASIGNNCDNCTSTIGLPFAVTVYGQTFAPGSVVNASSNGNLQFIGTNTDPNNVCLPYAGLNTSIMPYWDDLTTDCSGCGIFTSVSGSPGNRIFDIEWRAQAVSSGPEIVATPTQVVGAAQGRGPGQTKGRGASGGLVTEDLSGPLTPDDLANTLVGSGVTISNVAFTGADIAGGEFSGGTGIIGFESGVILGSGNINSVVGPNTFTNTTTINSTAGDPHLDALSAPEVTSDASVLEFDFVPAENTLMFDYVFSSEEYNEYAGPGFNYNDVFAFFVNGNDAGHNCALIGESPVSVDTINLKQNSAYYRDNDFAPNAPINTEMDGLTTVLSCLARVEPGVTNHMKLAIADVGDAAWDTNVFLKAGSVSSGPTATPSATSSPTATPTCVPPPPNMVAWYTLNEPTGPTAADIAGATANNGTWFGAPQVLNPGMVNRGLRFDGVDDWINVPDHPEVNFGTGSLTIDTWIRTVYTQNNTFIDKQGQQATGYEIVLVNGQLVLQLGVNGTIENYSNPSSPILNDGQWHHVAAVVDRPIGGTAAGRLYADGNVIHTFIPISGDLNNTAPLYLARHHQGPDFFNGDLDEVEFFNRALNDDEVRSIFLAGSAGKCLPIATATTTSTSTVPPTPTTTRTATPTLTPTASPTPARVNFEIRLFENPALNKFEIIYGGVSQGGDSATIGVQSGAGTRFKQYSCDTGSVSAGTRLIFTYGCPGTTTPSATPSGTSTVTRTATATVTATNTATPTYTPRPTNTPPGPNCIVAENATPVTYPPLGVITSTIFVPISGTIADLNVFDLHIARNNAPGSPLVVRADLISPDKTQVNLFNWGCKPPVPGSTDRMFITLDSEAAAPIPYCSDQVVKGTYQPDQPLTAYNNLFMPAGTWTLMLFTESQRRKADGTVEIAGSRPVAELLSYRKLYKTVQLAAVSPTAEGEPTVDPSAELSPEPEPTLAEPTKVAPEPTDTKTTGKATPTEVNGRASSTPTYDPAKSTTTVEPKSTVGTGRATGTATKGPVETPTDTPTEAPTETPTSVVGLPPPMGGTPTGTPNPNGGTLIRWGLQICFLPATATPTVTPTASATPCKLMWRTIPSPTTSPTLEDFLFSVDTLSATDAWAVGFTDDLNSNFAPVSMHWDGTVWNSVPVPNPGGVATALYDVKMIAPNNVWAVGYTTGPSSNTMTFIIHWNGTSWSVVPSPNPGGTENVLNGIAGVADNDLWAVGIHRTGSIGPVNLVLHWNGTSWSQVPNVPNPGTLGNSLDEVTLASPGELWAVGWQNNSGSIREGLVLRLDIVGGTWTIVQSAAPGTHSPLHDVAAIVPGQVWAVGEYAPGSGAITWRCNNVSCADIASPGEVLYGVTNVDKTLAWAVGRDDNNQALIIRWDGTTSLWSIDPNGPPGFSSTLYAVDALSPTHAWAVGNYAPTSGADFDNLIQWYSSICPSSQQAKYKTNSLPGSFGGGGPWDWSVGFDLLLAVVILAVAGAGFTIAFSISRPSHVIMEAQQAQAKRPASVRNASGALPVRIVRASRR